MTTNHTTNSSSIYNNLPLHHLFLFFFFNDTATTEIYTLSLHDALPIWTGASVSTCEQNMACLPGLAKGRRSEEHTSELQSQSNLVCRLLLEKKKSMSNPSDAARELLGSNSDSSRTGAVSVVRPLLL